MANTELIETMEEDVAEGLQGRYLTFRIGDTTYGVELMRVVDIGQIQPFTLIPNLPPYIKGVMNLRGKVVPVIDVRLKFHQEERPYDDKTCIVVVDIDSMNVGLIVDTVDDVATIEDGDNLPPPDLGIAATENFIGSIANIDGKVILNIDFDKFFAADLYDLK